MKSEMNDDELAAALEKAWNEKPPRCLSCGWMNAYYEVEGTFTETGDRPGEYHAPCRSEDAEDPWSHRGYFIYLDIK